MPPRNTPTARQARLGAELRKLRERAGKTAREAAALLGTDQAKISMVEAGRRGIGEDRIRRLATFYSCSDEALVTALCVIAREHRGQFWWDEYRGILPTAFLDVAELEHHAAYLRTLHMLVVPGVFQTHDYARAIFGSGLPSDELEARIEIRTRRGQIFERADPPTYEAIVHEAALRMRYGGRKAARAQLEHLLKVTDWPSVTLRVIPFAVEEITGHAQPMLYAGSEVPQLDTVQIDTPFGGRFVDAEAQLAKYRNLLDEVEGIALDATKSRDLISQVAQEM
ncbi:helix-turn-helix transcriptional regulator [Streptomyces sp. NPDC026206]|uniref:helix-turn-helix domain-containing protein n=1 Tax=Streptomyces sp. NPDC026206 TaxID=3157089 RepID=UPI0033E49F20